MSITNDVDLFKSVMESDVITLHALLYNGADVNIRDKHGWTTLMWATMNGYCDIAKMLLENGVDVHAKDWLGESALTLATELNQAEIIEMLAQAGAVE